MTQLSRELWLSSVFLRQRNAEPSPEPEALLGELADHDSARLIRELGSRDLLRLWELLLQPRWEPTAPEADTSEDGDAAAGQTTLLRLWGGEAPFIALNADDPITDIEWILDDIRAADPEAPPLIAWDLLSAIQPRLDALGLDRVPIPVPLPLLRDEQKALKAARDDADRTFDAAADSAASQLRDRQWDDLLDTLEGSPTLTLPGLVDGRANIRNRFDADDVIARHKQTLAAVRAEGSDPSSALNVMVVELTPPGDRPPFGLRAATPWRRAVPYPEGEDARAGWIWASDAIYDLDTLDEVLWAAVHDRADVVLFSPRDRWTYGASGIDCLLIARPELLQTVATQLNVDESYIEFPESP